MTTDAMTIDEEPVSKRIIPTWLGPLTILVLLVVALFVLHGELRAYRYHDITRAIFALPKWNVILALGFTGIAYGLLPAYDAIALSYVGRPLPLHRVAFSSFISYGLSQTLGFPLVTGSSVRYRFWSAWGLSTSEIAQAVSFVGATFVLGMIFLSGVVFLLEPARTMDLLGLPEEILRPLGVVLLGLTGGYIAWSAAQRRPLKVGGWEFPIPSLNVTMLQLTVATLDWAAAGAVLYALLPSGHGIRFLPFLGAFLLAQFAGQISHVPGGLGIFETLMVLLLKPFLPASSAIAALIAFRAVYYLVPFALSLLMLAAYEGARQRERVAYVATTAGSFAARLTSSLLPQALSATTFIAGVVLLVSGATPSVHGRIAALDRLLPLGVIELSHFAGSVVGACLLVLAWAIGRRLDAAYGLTVTLLVVGMIASLLKGLDYEEAIILAVVLSVVGPSRRAFYRKAAITSEPIGAGWIVALTVVAGATIWIGFFSYKHVDFSNELWFRFSTHGDAPRFLRATAGILAAFGIFALMRMLRHAEAEPALPTPGELERAREIMRTSADTAANLVFLGDKALLFSPSGKAFLMYGVSGRSWIALGDPIGPDDEVTELAWHFREEADRHGAWPVFYEVGTDRLPLYIDLGLTLLKLGEAAVVPLDTFNLQGGARKNLRRTITEVSRHGAVFSVVAASELSDIMPELKRVSDGWLSAKHTREKGFSLGRFDEAYIRQFPIGVVRTEKGIVAFANLLSSGEGTEISVDLMRYSPDAPTGVMEYLFIQLLLWGKERGYRRFNLGMAPLSGLQNRTLAPLWSRAGALLYRHGEHFYNFRGLRMYKDKFDPSWEPRYLASPGGLALPRVVANTAALISGGLKGVVSR
ncbi:MAG TPA: bifunctional lysylphosphatidylglycerol flippase/synthetase MprF [Gemmatimonadaceae bacterium]|nr:bifunctional lysylphosphatidylglycerol flippase/synthetase MprF [Gemmatimonadaceae bacterium]